MSVRSEIANKVSELSRENLTLPDFDSLKFHQL